MMSYGISQEIYPNTGRSLPGFVFYELGSNIGIKSHGQAFKIFIALLFLPLFLYPQHQNIKFEHLTVEDGLSSSRVNSILQDSKGFIWVAIGGGLNKYDGYTFTIYRNDPDDSCSLSNSDVVHIYEDPYARLWLSTLGGLNRFDPETENFTRYVYDPHDPASILFHK